jgi:hypothetical protein
MRARQLIGGAAYPPDVLRVIFEAFDDAWTEVGPGVGSEPGAVESARSDLATILLSLAKGGPIDRGVLRNAAVGAFRFKHRIT